MKHRFQIGFLLGSLLPLAALCFLGHSERVSLVFGAGFLLVPALLWPRRLAGWLEGLQCFYERFNAARLPPAHSSRECSAVGGPDVSLKQWTANEKPTPERARRRQDVVIETLVRNYRCPKGKARAIAARVAGIQDEDARVIAAMRMVRA